MNISRHILLLLIAIFLSAPAVLADYVTCESTGGYRHCSARDIRDAEVFLDRQLSKSSCSRGRSWDVDSRGIWVDKGCRATFEISRDKGYNRYDARGRYYEDIRNDRERLELEREREELERERERLEREKQEAIARAEVKEACPSGYVPGRCEDRQRKHGCKDFRMPHGLGCRSRM